MNVGAEWESLRTDMQEIGKAGGHDRDRKFDRKLQEAIEEHFDDFPEGNAYYEMREIFDRSVAMEGIKRTNKVKLAAKRIGVALNNIRHIDKKRIK